MPTTYLSGPEKSAILMLAVGPDNAAKIFSKLDIEQVKEVSQSLAMLGQVNNGAVEEVLNNFLTTAGGGVSLVGNFDKTEEMLGRFLDNERVTQIMEEIRGPAGRTVWEKLGNVNEQVLAAYLTNEYPQTVAVVVSRLEPSHAARVLAALPTALASETITRMLKMEVVQKEVMSDVENTLRSEFMSNLARTNRRDNHEAMAEIFNYFDGSTEKLYLAELEKADSEACEKVKSLMFTFNDLIKLDTAGVQTLLKAIDNRTLALALKSANEAVSELFFQNMSERAGKILREEIAGSGPVKVKDVEEAQQKIVTTAKELAGTGEIVISDGKDDELVE